MYYVRRCQRFEICAAFATSQRDDALLRLFEVVRWSLKATYSAIEPSKKSFDSFILDDDAHAL